MTHVPAVSLCFPAFLEVLGDFHCIFQGFWAGAIFAFLILLCFPAFQGSRAKMVSKKARSLGCQGLKTLWK